VTGDLEAMVKRHSPTVSRTSIQHLFCVYGCKAPAVLALVEEHPELGEKIVAGMPDIKAQVVYAVRHELAHSLEDICRRRTTLSMVANYGYDALPAVRETLIKFCGWDEAKGDRQTQQYIEFIERNCLPDYHIEATNIDERTTESYA
jgi:glycerol-3-phosphate dehydrogenase